MSLLVREVQVTTTVEYGNTSAAADVLQAHKCCIGMFCCIHISHSTNDVAMKMRCSQPLLWGTGTSDVVWHSTSRTQPAWIMQQ